MSSVNNLTGDGHSDENGNYIYPLRASLFKPPINLPSASQMLAALKPPECPICYDSYRAEQPVLTPCCRNAIGEQCLRNLLKRLTPNQRLSCPFCRKAICASEREVSTWPRAAAPSRQRDELNERRRQQLDQQARQFDRDARKEQEQRLQQRPLPRNPTTRPTSTASDDIVEDFTQKLVNFSQGNMARYGLSDRHKSLLRTIATLHSSEGRVNQGSDLKKANRVVLKDATLQLAWEEPMLGGDYLFRNPDVVCLGGKIKWQGA